METASHRSPWQLLLTAVFLGAVGSLVFSNSDISSGMGVRRLQETVVQKELSNDIAYVHLGKCHGLGLKETLLKEKNGIVARRGIEWYHMQKVNVDKHKEFIALVRDPVDRTVSNFLFEHPKNAPYRKNGMAVTLPYVSKLELYDCYDTVNDLATKGLAGDKNERCPHVAKHLFRDHVRLPGLPHFVYKYDFYYEDLLKKADSKTIYVVRNEKMVYDLNKINTLTGGTGTPYSNIVELSHWKNGFDPKNLPAKEKKVSEAALVPLCQALCSEIQIYKQLLQKAANLGDADRTEMMTSLGAKCPNETASDECPKQERLMFSDAVPTQQ